MTSASPLSPLDLDSFVSGLTVAQVLPELTDALAAHGAAVLHAPPGTGKTTAVPPHVALTLAGAPGVAGRADDGPSPSSAAAPAASAGSSSDVAADTAAAAAPRVLVTQPRRVAVRAAWRRLHAAVEGAYRAAGAAEPAARQAADAAVGYTVRGDAVGHGRSQVEFLTPGVLVRRLLNDPELAGVGAVLLDEVHERDLDTDLLFALLADLRQLREDLQVVAMSATLDAEALAARWAEGMGQDAVPVVRTEDVLHPLTERWAPYGSSRLTARGGCERGFLDHVAEQTVAAHAAALAEDPGIDALVFLPGVAEVEAVAERLRARVPGHDVLTLHGRQEPAEQDAAVAGRAPGGAPRIVVATNVAESSLTVPGVRLVIDSALAREPRRDAGRAMTGLVTVQVSRAAAGQRAGRAARLGPGTVVRCCSRSALGTAPAAPTPALDVADLAPLVLALAAWGAPRGEGLVLPQEPPAGALAEAEARLQSLGAVDVDGRITAHGTALSMLPVPPHLGHALGYGAQAVGEQTAADVVALLAADLRAPGADLTAALAQVRRGGPESRMWRREADRLERLLRRGALVPSLPLPDDGAGASASPGTSASPDASAATAARGSAVSSAGPRRLGRDEEVGYVVALAAPDRIARRVGESDAYLLASGTRASLPADSPLRGSHWLAVAEVQRTGSDAEGTGAVVRAAAPLGEEAAIAAGAGLLRQEHTAVWSGGRLRGSRRRLLGGIELAAHSEAPTVEAAADAVRAAWAEEGLKGWGGEAADTLRRRVHLLHRVLKDPWPDMSAAALAQDEDLVAAVAAQVVAGTPRSRVDLAGLLQGLLPWPAASELDTLAPALLPIPSGRTAAVEYPEVGDDGQPVLAAKLQEFFGASGTPTVADGRQPVLLHLLSPAGRPLAVTADLPSFWAGAYAQVRADMRGRYPKHPWPEDPTTAEATGRTRRR